MTEFILKKFILAKRNNLKEVVYWWRGSPLRNFLHVDDLSASFIYALAKWDPNDANAPKDIYGENLLYLNVGFGEEISLKDLAEKIASFTKYNGNILWDTDKHVGTFRKNLDLSRIKSIGWEVKIKLKDGLI